MMRQLETALALLADRAESLPPDVVVERLISQLTAEGIVADSAKGNNPIVPENSPDLDGPDSMVRRRYGWRPLVVFGATAAVVLIAVASVLFFGQDRGDVVIEPASTTTIPGLLPTPWEQFREESPEWDIPNVIRDQEVFIAAYNTAFRAHESCEQAYGAAKNAYEGFHRILEEWNDEVNERPGLEYDRFVGELRASNDWLIEHQCAGAGDFISLP
jgi:hypothetical protein